MSLYFSLFFICFVATVNGKCFDVGNYIKKCSDEEKKLREPLTAKCKEEQPEASKVKIQDCFRKKYHKALEKCYEANFEVKNSEKSDKTRKSGKKGKSGKNGKQSIKSCMIEELGTSVELTYEEYKKIIHEVTKDNMTDEIEKAIDSCKNDEKNICVPLALMKGPCPELKKIYGKIEDAEKNHGDGNNSGDDEDDESNEDEDDDIDEDDKDDGDKDENDKDDGDKNDDAEEVDKKKNKPTKTPKKIRKGNKN